MFKKKTVFVLGAGASWHYGYPTGEELVAEVQALAKRLRFHCQLRLRSRLNLGQMPAFIGGNPNVLTVNQGGIEGPWNTLIKSCEDLIDRLDDVSPLVIDYFLGWNASLADLGRLLIAGALMKRESQGAGSSQYTKQPDQVIGKDHWVRFIIHQLLMPKPGRAFNLLENEVSFLTFNYDRSLESALHLGLEAIDILSEEDIRKFMTGDRVLHMYGRLASARHSYDYSALEKNIAGNNALETIMNANALIDGWNDAAKGLRVIDPVDKHDDAIAVEAKERTNSAQVLYFLGFGFDENNIRRLGFPLPMNGMTREIYWTNFGDLMTVNKKAGKAFGADLRYKMVVANDDMSVEKSTKDVYHAIASDFGALAE
jgi:hypothetical protein